MYAVFLIIILIAFTVLVVLRRNVKWGIYVIGTSEVLFRLLHLLGDNLGVADLPSFTVDGTSYHLGSYAGFKLLGVRPTTDAKRAAVLQQLALYLTDAKKQNVRSL